MQERDQFDHIEEKADEVEAQREDTIAKDFLSDHVAAGFEKPSQDFQDFKNDTEAQRDMSTAEDLSKMLEADKMTAAQELEADKITHDFEKDQGIKPEDPQKDTVTKPEELQHDSAVKPEDIQRDLAAKPEEPKDTITVDDKQNIEKDISADTKPEAIVVKPDEQLEQNVINDQKPEAQIDHPEEQKDNTTKPEEPQNDTVSNDTANQDAASVQDDQNQIEQAEPADTTTEPQDDTTLPQDQFEPLDVDSTDDQINDDTTEEDKPEITDDDDDADIVADSDQKSIEQHSTEENDSADKSDQDSIAERDAQAVQKEQPDEANHIDTDSSQNEQSDYPSTEDIQAAFDKAISNTPDNDFSFGQDFLDHYDTDKGFLLNLIEFFIDKIKKDDDSPTNDKKDDSDTGDIKDPADWSDVIKDFADWTLSGTGTAFEDVINIISDISQGDFIEAAKDFLHLLLDCSNNVPGFARDFLDQAIDKIPGSNAEVDVARDEIGDVISQEANNIAGEIEVYSPDSVVESIDPSVDVVDAGTSTAETVGELSEGAEGVVEAAEMAEAVEAATATTEVIAEVVEIAAMFA